MTTTGDEKVVASAATAPPSAPVGATLSNPWTGKPRDYRDVDSDPEGVLCVEPGAPLKAATGVEGLTTKEAWWAGYRAGKGLPADTPRQEALAQQPASHPDDAAVDAFAAAMKEKLAAARAKGRGGWDGDESGMQQRLSDMLRAHVEKGDPRDVANFAMFLHQRGEAIMPAQQPAAVDGAMVEG